MSHQLQVGKREPGQNFFVVGRPVLANAEQETEIKTIERPAKDAILFRQHDPAGAYRLDDAGFVHVPDRINASRASVPRSGFRERHAAIGIVARANAQRGPRIWATPGNAESL